MRAPILMTCGALGMYVLGLAPSPLLAQTAPFGFGRPATGEEVAALDIDVRPDGQGLPDGRGTPAEGETVYAARCAACHGKTGREGPADILVGREPREGFPFGRNPALPRTIGNYWPYATTLYDYIRRAMPPASPGSLSADETYAVVAYLLLLNELVPADVVIDRASLPRVVMSAKDRFVVDPRGGPGRGR
ncbi:MAG: c-type cytochrome [bacterium]